MALRVRFFDGNGEQLEGLVGETPGWNGSLEKPVFTTRRITVTAPPGAHSFWLVISSAGPPETLGTLLVKGVTVARASGHGPPEVVITASGAGLPG